MATGHGIPAAFVAHRGDRYAGSVLLIGLDNARATVPPAWSDAPASRWSYDEPAPTREQLDVYAWLTRDRKAAGLYTPPPPATAREISAAIKAMRPTA